MWEESVIPLKAEGKERSVWRRTDGDTSEEEQNQGTECPKLGRSWVRRSQSEGGRRANGGRYAERVPLFGKVGADHLLLVDWGGERGTAGSSIGP